MSYINPRSKLFQHPEKLAELKRGQTTAPINIEIDLSNRCSLGCEWCHFAYTHTRGPHAKTQRLEGAVTGGDLMPTGLAYRMLDEFVTAGVQSVTWTGGGEPTLHRDFAEIVRYAYSGFGDYPEGVRSDLRRGRISQGLYTHGGHITHQLAAQLKQMLTFCYVSLDAADRADYKRDKGVDRFDQACAGVEEMVDADGDAVVGLGFLLTEENWSGFDAMIHLSKCLGVDYCQFRPTILFDIEDPGKLAEHTKWMTEALRWLSPLEGTPGVEIDLARFARYQSWSGHGYETCYWSALQSVVTPNGKMWTCVNKREHPGEMIGDLSTESFAEIWERHRPAGVNAGCRLLCRGDVANQALDEIMRPALHSEFP